MPIRGFDCFGLEGVFAGWTAYVLGDDGKLHPVKINRAKLKLLYPWRKARRHIRRMEKERRKRLKEVTGDA